MQIRLYVLACGEAVQVHPRGTPHDWDDEAVPERNPWFQLTTEEPTTAQSPKVPGAQDALGWPA